MTVEFKRRWSCWTLVMLALMWGCDGAPLRGSRRTAPRDNQWRRRAMQDKVQTEAPVEPTRVPTSAPSVSPSFSPSETPTEGKVTESPVGDSTSSPTLAPVVGGTPSPSLADTTVATSAPTVALPADRRYLYPFSLTIKGELGEESLLRENLRLYLVQAMKKDIAAITDIHLELTPSEFEDKRRNLQEATLLQYGGSATLDLDAGSPPTTAQIREAQQVALEDGEALQGFLSQTSDAPEVLQVKVADFPAVVFQDDDDDRSIPADDDSNVGKIVGIVIGSLVVVGIVIGLLVWREYEKPPPPPPYDLESFEDDAVESVGDIEELNKSLQVAVTASMSGSDGVVSPSGLYSPRIDESAEMDDLAPADASSEATEEQEAKELEIHATGTGNGMEVIDVSRSPKAIDLTVPAKQPKGMEAAEDSKQEPKPATPSKASKGHDDTTPSKADNESVGDSSYEESMAGYSLETDGPDALERRKPTVTSPEQVLASLSTPPRPVTNPTLQPRASPVIQNNAQMRWFEQPRLRQHRSEGFISSDSESNVTLEDVSNPLRDGTTGVEKTAEVFYDDDEDEIEVTSQASEENHSSYKEDDTRGSSSSVLSVSDTESDGVYAAQNPNTQESPVRNTHGSLGYFAREAEEDYLDDYDVLPQVTPAKYSGVATDGMSDAPSDEQHDMLQHEQDLSGFQKAEAIQKGLDHFATPNRSFASPSSSETRIVSDGSWEEEPEKIEAMVKERRRLRRAARNKRAVRKQPPVTMEV